MDQATRNASPDQINDASLRLGALITELQARLQQREMLLNEFPTTGQTPESLQLALSQIEHPLSSDLLERCQQISSEVSLIFRRATSIFIGHYHLSNVTEEMLRILAGHPAKAATYDGDDSDNGTSLIDQAA